MLDRETLDEELFAIEQKLKKTPDDLYWRRRFYTVLSQMNDLSDEKRSQSSETRSSITGY